MQYPELSKSANENLETWLSSAKYAQYHGEIDSLIKSENWQELEDAFYQVIPFGTGGRRGTVGLGSARINKVTIGEAAQGLINYVKSSPPSLTREGAGGWVCVIAYDVRNTSQEFAEYVATIFAANSWEVHLFDGPRATPELSFAVRELNATVGVVISASHNPPADNGFKAYWTDGGQVVPPHDKGIIAAGEKVSTIKSGNFSELLEQNKIQYVSSDLDQKYFQAVLGQSHSESRSVKVAYSPLHGTGFTSIYEVLQAGGFDVALDEEQASLDGNFPSVPNHSPNPEILSTNDHVKTFAESIDADIAITSDPDADRLGVLVKQVGEHQFLTGNQIAALICDYVVNYGDVKSNHFIAKTIVTTDLIKAIADVKKIKIYDHILIGFKYIGKLILDHEDGGDEQFLFGGEESHGILAGSYARDKDAAVAALLISEYASVLKDNNQTLLDALNNLYCQHGLFVETLQSIGYPGADGFSKMQQIMQSLRERDFNKNPLAVDKEKAGVPAGRSLGEGWRVVNVVDRLEETDPLLKGDVLIFHLSEDGTNRITIRPSGTEPKIKIYVQLHQDVDKNISDEDLRKLESELKSDADKLVKAIMS